MDKKQIREYKHQIFSQIVTNDSSGVTPLSKFGKTTDAILFFWGISFVGVLMYSLKLQTPLIAYSWLALMLGCFIMDMVSRLFKLPRYFPCWALFPVGHIIAWIYTQRYCSKKAKLDKEPAFLTLEAIDERYVIHEFFTNKSQADLSSRITRLKEQRTKLSSLLEHFVDDEEGLEIIRTQIEETDSLISQCKAKLEQINELHNTNNQSLGKLKEHITRKEAVLELMQSRSLNDSTRHLLSSIDKDIKALAENLSCNVSAIQEMKNEALCSFSAYDEVYHLSS